MQNTRSNVRRRRRFLVRLGRTSSFTADVGHGGFCLRLMKVLPVSSTFDGSIVVAGAEVPFTARVAWARPGDCHLGLAGTMGVAFTRIAAGFVGAIEPADLSGASS
jgi:hypothetical protein